MKFTSKVVLGVFWIVITCFTFGGTIIVDTNFEMLLLEEKQISKNITETIYELLNNETKLNEIDDFSTMLHADKDFIIEKIADAIIINFDGRKIDFIILSKNDKNVYSYIGSGFDFSDVENVEINKRVYTYEKKDGKNFLHTIRPFVFMDNIYYIVFNRDITSIFNNQKQQYEILIKTMIFLSGISVIMSIIFSKILLRQVTRLNDAAKVMSEGNILKRVEVIGNDELSVLARNFNIMADSVKTHMDLLEEEAINKEYFVAAFSHEIKTPLTAIIGYADMLRMNPTDTIKIEKGAEYIFSEGKRLEKLSKRLLQIMSIKNEELTFVEIEMKKWIDLIAENLKYSLRQKNIKLVVDIEEDTLLIEPELINMVIINIIDNAQKASKEGDKILISGSIRGDFYVVNVTDKGVGMEPMILSRIKEPFYKADQSRVRDISGAGLGLSLSQVIMEKHNAEMIFYSKPHEGTTVELVFKRRRNSEENC